MTDGALKKVRVEVPQEDGWPPVSAESLWVRAQDGRYVVANIPLFVDGLAVDDLIEVTEHGDHVTFDVVSQSGHSTLSLLIDANTDVLHVVDLMKRAGCDAESGFGEFIAVDVPPTVPVRAALDIVDQLGTIVLECMIRHLSDRHRDDVS